MTYWINDAWTFAKPLLYTGFGSLLTKTVTDANQRKNDAKAARAALRSHGQRVAQALTELRAERRAHDKIRVGKDGRNAALKMAAAAGTAQLMASSREKVADRFLEAIPAYTQVLIGWRKETDQASFRVLTPLLKLHEALVPLIASANAEVSARATDLWKRIEGSAPDQQVEQAFSDLMVAIRAATALPTPRWRRAFHRPRRRELRSPDPR